MKKSYGLLYFSILIFTTNAYANSFSAGKYESLNGNYIHVFEAGGDYTGTDKSLSKSSTSSGLYEQANNICWSTKSDGSKGPTGNILIFADEGQCCLDFRQISNKYAVSKIWLKGTGILYRVCKDQVLKKVNNK